MSITWIKTKPRPHGHLGPLGNLVPRLPQRTPGPLGWACLMLWAWNIHIITQSISMLYIRILRLHDCWFVETYC